MKSINKLFFGIAGASLMFAACVKEAPHEPGQPDVEDCQGVYFPAQDEKWAYEPNDTADYPFYIIVERANDSTELENITVPVEIEGTGAEYVTKLQDIVFEPFQSVDTVYGWLNHNTLEAGNEVDITIAIKDPQYASRYSQNPSYVRFTAVVEKWDYLGKAEFWDLWLWGSIDEPGYAVDIYQNASNTDLYRLVDPYKQLWEDAGSAYISGGWALTDPANKIEFQVMRAGQTINEEYPGYETEITSDGAIYYSPIKMGLNNPYYGADVYAYNPADMGSLAGDEANLVWNKVANWQDNGLPSVAYLAGYRYMPGLGGWGGYDSPDEAIVVRFPGGVFVDYTTYISTGSSEEGELPITFTSGKDVDKIDYCIYEGELTSKEIRTAKANIAAGVEPDVETIKNTHDTTVIFQADTTCIFTIVSVSFDVKGEEQYNVSGSFGYVKKGDEEKVQITAGVNLELPNDAYQAAGYSPLKNLMFTLYGKEIKSASIALVTAEDYETDAESCWALVQAVDEEILASINKAGGYTGMYTSLLPKTEYVLLAEYYNGYQAARYAASCTTDGYAPEKKATGTYTLNAFFEGDVPGRELYFDPNTEQSYFIKDYVGYGTNFNFDWVEATDSLIIPCPQVMTSSSNYGAIYFGEVLDFIYYLYGSSAPAAIAYYEANGLEVTSIAGTSKYIKDSTLFKFAVFYYAEAGYIGSGVETYQIDPVSRTLKKKSSSDIHWVKAITPSAKLNPDNIVWKLPYVERPLKAAKGYTLTGTPSKHQKGNRLNAPLKKEVER